MNDLSNSAITDHIRVTPKVNSVFQYDCLYSCAAVNRISTEIKRHAIKIQVADIKLI